MHMKKRIDKLEKQILKEDFWNDTETARNTLREKSRAEGTAMDGEN